MTYESAVLLCSSHVPNTRKAAVRTHTATPPRNTRPARAVGEIMVMMKEINADVAVQQNINNLIT